MYFDVHKTQLLTQLFFKTRQMSFFLSILHSQPKVSEDMSRDKKADPQSSGIAQLQARTMELIN